MSFPSANMGRARQHSRSSLAFLATLWAVVELALVLRLYKLDAQSLWSDEGASVVMAGRSIPDILHNAALDIHPPLYYILLSLWAGLTGTSEYALRFFSTIAGVLLVALTYTLGARLFSRKVGVIGAFFAATSPLLVYYSQEARMYLAMAAFSTLSVYVFLRATGLFRQTTDSAAERTSWLLFWLAFVALTAAALYSQYYAFTVLLFENLLFLGAFWRFWEKPRLWLAWVGSQIVLLLLYLPWLALALPTLLSWPAISEPFTLPELLRRIFLVFSFGLSWEATATGRTAALALGLLGFALLWPFAMEPQARQGITARYWRIAATLLYLAMPLLSMYLLSLSRPSYNPKFLLQASPPFYILLALGAASLAGLTGKALGRLAFPKLSRFSVVWQAAVLLACLGAMSYAISRSALASYDDPKYARDDYRGLVAYLKALEQPRDVVILNAPGQIEIFRYYDRGALQAYPLPRQRPLDKADTAAQLEQLVVDHDRLWVVEWATEQSDPEGFIESWLGQRAFRSESRWFGGVRLVLYSLPSSQLSTQIQFPLRVSFGGQIELLGYSLGTTSARAGPSGRLEVEPGEVVQLSLFWSPQAPLQKRYTVFAHLIDPSSYLWGQHDAEPVGGTRSTTGWQPGQTIVDNHGIPVLLGTPSLSYQIEVGLYETATGQRLTVSDSQGKAQGDRVLLSEIQVQRARAAPPVQGFAMGQRLNREMGDVRLLGYDFGKLGTAGPESKLRSGDWALLVLFWEVLRQPSTEGMVVIQVLREDELVRELREQPLQGRLPLSSWRAGDIVRDQHRFLLDLPPGSYSLRIGLSSDPTIAAGEPVALQPFTVN